MSADVFRIERPYIPHKEPRDPSTMRCRECGGSSRVTNSRGVERETITRRRRECLACGRRWTTYESEATIPT